jgi:hypothetical protein
MRCAANGADDFDAAALDQTGNEGRGRSMRQKILSVVLEVNPESAGNLSLLIEALKRNEENPGQGVAQSYDGLKAAVPVLHFMSMSVFLAADYDPIFVLEANFDGEPGPFWAQLEARLEPYLRPMLRCCKRPGDSDGPLYDAVTADQSRYPIAPYLERRALTPSARHQGNRGLGRDQILREVELFKAIQAELVAADAADTRPYRNVPPQQIHQKLRQRMLAGFPWLDTPAPVRISWAERTMDLARLLAFVLSALFCLSIPGLVFALFTPTPRFFGLLAVAIVIVGIWLWRIKAPLTGKGAPAPSGGLTPGSLSTLNDVTSLAHPVGLIFWVLVILVLYVFVATAVLALFAVPVTGLDFTELWRPTFNVVKLGLASAVFSVLAIVLWLRLLERRDSSQDAPTIDQRELRKMTHREDWIPQNHMGSVVLVKPGILRMALFRAGHLALGLIARVVATDGYLGTMRTIHFAHWAFLNNGSRLLFFSNFDHSWDSYLDDFIEKAHGGLTLAWGSGVGFPATRFLVLDGASHGREFKAWARHSMAVNRFWYSAYKDLTVDQIERDARIANGLRKTSLKPQEAMTWALDL